MTRILYAEDEFSNRRMLEIQLSKRGIEVDLVEDGVTALSLARRGGYALVILDVHMPGMSGDEVARVLKQERPDIPIMAITSDDTRIDDLKNSGFDEVLIKPLMGTGYMDVIHGYIVDHGG